MVVSFLNNVQYQSLNCPGRRVARNVFCSSSLSDVAIWPEDANIKFLSVRMLNCSNRLMMLGNWDCVAISSFLGTRPEACGVYYAVLLSGSK